jgi:hypothetical protein
MTIPSSKTEGEIVECIRKYAEDKGSGDRSFKYGEVAHEGSMLKSWSISDPHRHQGLTWIVSIGISQKEEAGEFTILVGREKIPGMEINTFRVAMRPPRISRDVYKIINGSSHFLIKSDEDLLSFAKKSKTGFDRPAFLVSVDPISEKPLIDIEKLFSGVAGTSDIYLIDKRAGMKIQDFFSREGINEFAYKNYEAYKGAIRLIKEEIPADQARPFLNPIYLPHRIANEENFLDNISERSCLLSVIRNGSPITIEKIEGIKNKKDASAAEDLLEISLNKDKLIDSLNSITEQLNDKIREMDNKISRLEYDLERKNSKIENSKEEAFASSDEDPCMELFKTSSGKRPVLDFIDGLPKEEKFTAQRKLIDLPEALAMEETKNYEKIGEFKILEKTYKTFEYRIKTKDHWIRLFFVKSEETNGLMVVDGIMKKSNQIEEKDRESAIKRSKEAINSGYK